MNHHISESKSKNPINFGSLEGALRRIYKACQVQLINFKFGNSIYEEDFLTSYDVMDKIKPAKKGKSISEKKKSHRSLIIEELIQIEQ